MGEIADRRSGRRYDLKLPLRYLIVHKNEPPACGGVGLTHNLSTGGVAFEAESPLVVGSIVEMWISWPTGTEHETGLEMHVAGMVIRAHRAAVP